jgi:type I restriction enzyme M protein
MILRGIIVIREDEILFMDLRQWGEPFEKKYHPIQLYNIYRTLLKLIITWQQTSNETEYEDIAEYCYSASIDEVKYKDYSLVPSKYIEFINRDENIDFNVKMNSLKEEFSRLLKDEEKSKNDLLKVFKDLGYEIEL